MANNPEELRLTRDSYAVVYSEVVKLAGLAEPPLICVVEGVDSGYFRPRIAQWLVSRALDWRIEFLNAAGRANVLSVREAVSNNNATKSSHVLYFIDRDIRDPGEDGGLDTFVTCGYSVENYYASKSCVRSAISYFGFHDKITDDSRSGIDGAMLTYGRMLTSFVASTLTFNAWIRAQRSKGCRRVSVSSFDQRQRVILDFGQETAHWEVELTTLSGLPNPENHPTLTEFQEAQTYTKDNLDVQTCRGKQLMLFVIRFVESVLERFADNGGDYYIVGASRVQLSQRSFVSDLSNFADTPHSLLGFLNKYFEARIAHP